VAGHIAGAVSVPIYAVERSLPQLPRERWIVAYCACPHAASGAAAGALRRNGYDRVRLLDEGYVDWRRGYPVREGARP
jgi:cytochrome c oxidase cbb3-type subunit 3/ubiquinol-cytochrome c reductase cytochrome c subunit